MQIPPLQLNVEQIAALKQICGADPEELRKAVAYLKQIDVGEFHPNTLYAAADRAFSDPALAGAAIGQALVHSEWIRRAGASPLEVSAALRLALQQIPQNERGSLDQWSQVETVFAELLALPIVQLVAASFDLTYDQPLILREARILTDIRPIYSPDAREIRGAVVAHVMHLHVQSVSGRQELAIAIDSSDIQFLALLLDRAEQKALTARRLMKDKAGIAVMSNGEDDATSS